MTAPGFPPAAVDFFARLEVDNTKAFWSANKATYDDDVRAPMEALVDELEAAEGVVLRIYRPHRDVRFSKDKAPYKTFIGAVGWSDAGRGYHVQLGAEGLLTGTGYPQFAKDQLERYRAAVDEEASGTALEAVVEALRDAGHAATGGFAPSLKVAPRGVPKDHPRLALLKRKGLVVNHRFGTPAWLATPEVVDRVREVWRASEPLLRWLDDHVGPSTIPPEELWGRGRR